MTKEDFKNMFKECFDIRLNIEYTPNYTDDSDYSLKVSIIDKESKEEITESMVNLGDIR